MTGGGATRRHRLLGAALPAGCALAISLVLAVLGASVAQAKVVFIHGKAYGEMLTPRAVSLSSPAGRASPLTVGGPQSQLTYGGGPLMLSSTLYLIFWGPKGSFPTDYTAPIIQYAKDLQAADSLTTDEFSVAEQYANAEHANISGKITFGGELFDTTAYPALDKAEGCVTAPCVTDSQIQSEILNDIKEQGWPTDPPAAPEAQYLLYTPSGVVSCDGPGSCSTSEEGYCAYHSQITGIGAEKRVATYSDLPYEPECDSRQAPAGVEGNADADGTLDSEIHEIVESATDPAQGTGYTDAEGNEAADKCAYPVVESQPDVYGPPLGGSLTMDTAFNQLINGHSYYTQQIWSDDPTKTPASSAPAGCAARLGPTPEFTAPASGQTGEPVSFDASASYDISEPIGTYEWNFGDGSPADTSSGVEAKHIYLQPGTYQVALTVSDSSGAQDASTQTIPITITGAAIGPPTASIGSPQPEQTFTLDQIVTTSFTCQEAAGGPGLASCTDSAGNPSPGVLDTSTAGPYSYTVTAVSLDGLHGTATIHYTVTNSSSGPGSGGSSGGSSTGSTSSAGGSGSSSSGGSGSSGSGGSSTEPGARNEHGGAKPATLTSAQKLAQALETCRKLPKKKRAKCVAAAKKRYAKKGKSRGKKQKAKPKRR